MNIKIEIGDIIYNKDDLFVLYITGIDINLNRMHYKLIKKKGVSQYYYLSISNNLSLFNDLIKVRK